MFTARKRSLQRLCFYTCLSVILFMRGGVPGQVHTPWQVHPPGRYTPLQAGRPPGHVHPQPLGRYTPRAGTPPSSACWDMVNKRVVCIPLECILVSQVFVWPWGRGGWFPSKHHWSHDWRGLHPGGGQTPQDTTGYGQRAGGMHPTGMHSCCFFFKVNVTIYCSKQGQ